jgi:transcriptional regulator with XRE-family HTH domain
MDAIILRDRLLGLMEGMSESKLARVANIPKATINRILSGRTPDPRASTLIPIAQYFGVSLEQLLGIVPLPAHLPLQAKKIEHTNFLQLPFMSMEQIYSWHCGEYTSQQHQNIVKDEARHVMDNCYITQVDTVFMQPKFFNKTYIVVNPQLKAQSEDYVIYYIAATQAILLRQLVIEQNQHFLVCVDSKLQPALTLTAQDLYLGKIVKSEVYLTEKD